MKKNKGLIITIIILSVLVLLIGGYIVYEKTLSTEKNNFGSEVNKDVNNITENNNWDNEVNNNDNDTTVVLNDYLKNITAFALKYEEEKFSLIALENNGEERIIYDFTNYDRKIESARYYYDSTNGVIYLSIESCDKENFKDTKHNIASIDLNTNGEDYKLNILTEIKVERDLWDMLHGADNITKLGNYIYFANSHLYKMNLSNYNVEKLDVTSKSRAIEVLGYKDNILIYNSEDKIYKYNLSNNNKEKIAENAIIKYIYGNELIYVDVTDYKNIYKSYNLDTNEVKQISSDVGGFWEGVSYVIPYQNSYLSSFGDTFYYNNNSFKLSCDKISFDAYEYFDVGTYISYSDHIIVTGYVCNGSVDGPVDMIDLVINIDLSNQIINSVKESNAHYHYVTYIK